MELDDYNILILDKSSLLIKDGVKRNSIFIKINKIKKLTKNGKYITIIYYKIKYIMLLYRGK